MYNPTAPPMDTKTPGMNAIDARANGPVPGAQVIQGQAYVQQPQAYMQQPPVVQQYGGAPIQGAPVPGAVIQGAVVPPQAQVQYVQQPQMVAQPQMVQPQMVQPQMVQPTMVVQQPVHQCFFALDRHPVRMECPFCRAQITTVMREEAGPSLAQWAACCGLCCIGLWPCACVPFCVSELRDVTHTCPQCQQRVGRVSQMSGSYDARRGQR